MFQAISIARFRGFRKVEVGPLDRFNLILGKNNVGKTAFLEAIYLLVGPTNPELPLRVNVFRGIQQVRAEPEEMWGWLFYGKNLDSVIELEAANEKKKRRVLRISLEAPKKFGFTRQEAQKQDPVLSTTSTAAKAADLILKYTDESGQRTRTRAFLRENALQFERTGEMRFPNSIFVNARAGYSSENPERYSKLEEIGQERTLIPALQVLEPRLKRLAVLITGNGPMIHGDIGIGTLVPVPLMGEGIGKLLTLLLSIVSSKNGVVMVDEIESGLHHAVMASVWTAIAKACRDSDVQLISTTHSWECLRTAHESFSTSETYDFKVHRLERRENEIESVAYTQEMIETALKSGLELR